jgi:phage FluMu protein Com
VTVALAVEARRVEPQIARPWRCRRCDVLLARVIIARGSRIEIVCRRCRTLNTIESDDSDAGLRDNT